MLLKILGVAVLVIIVVACLWAPMRRKMQERQERRRHQRLEELLWTQRKINEISREHNSNAEQEHKLEHYKSLRKNLRRKLGFPLAEDEH